MSKFKFDALALPVDTPARMPICHPHTLKPLVDKDGQPAYLDLLSTDSEACIAYDRKVAEERASNPIRAKIGPADLSEAGCRRLAHLARGWYLVDFDGNPILDPDTGKPILFSEKNAYDLLSNHRMKWLQDQALIFLGDRANFPLRSVNS